MTKNLYYKKRNGDYYYIPKTVVNSKINCYDPATYLPYLKGMDYPYFHTVWKSLRDYGYKDNILSRYINIMRLRAYKNFGYKDSDFFREEEVK